LASANFSEVRSLNKKCRMKSIDLAAQLRNLGLIVLPCLLALFRHGPRGARRNTREVPPLVSSAR
jgi:hypothetical protein